MIFLRLALLLILPISLLLTPVVLTYKHLVEVLVTYTVVLLFITIQCYALYQILTPSLYRSVSRYQEFARFIRGDMLLVLFSNILFSYFFSTYTNIWFNDPFQDSLALFWCVSSAQSFVFDIILNHKYCYKIPSTKVSWIQQFRLSIGDWLLSAILASLKLIKIVLPCYVIFLSDITWLTSALTPGSIPIRPLSRWVLLQPGTALNIAVVTTFTHFVLTVGFHATLHLRTFVKYRQYKETEQPLDHLITELSQPNIISSYESYFLLNQLISGSRKVRSELLRVNNGFPVLWHKLHKNWIERIVCYKRRLDEKKTPIPPVVSPKVERSMPASGRQLAPSPRDPLTRLYSVRTEATTPQQLSNRSRLLTVFIKSASEVSDCLRDSARSMVQNSRIGRFLLTEQPHVLFDNKLSDLSILLVSTAVLGKIYAKGPLEDKHGCVQLTLRETLNIITSTILAIEQVPLLSQSALYHLYLKKSLQMFLYTVANSYGAKLLTLPLEPETLITMRGYVEG